MNEDKYGPIPPIPEEIRRQWSTLPDEERRELERTWALAGTARMEAASEISDAEAERSLIEAVSSPLRKRREKAPVGRRSRMRMAAGLALFIAGFGLSFLLLRSDQDAPVASLPQFMLLLHRDTSADLSADEQEQVVQEYVAWARELGAFFVAGDELAGNGMLLSASGGSVTRTPLTNPEVSGYFIITAEDADDAARIAAKCPHLTHDGTVEVRRIIEH